MQGSLLGAIEPVSATAFSALWLGTAFSGADWVGFVLMMAMIFLVTAEKPEAAAQGEQTKRKGSGCDLGLTRKSGVRVSNRVLCMGRERGNRF